MEQSVSGRFRLLIQQNVLGIFLEINKIYAHAQAVDTRPPFPPLQQPGYEASNDGMQQQV